MEDYNVKYGYLLKSSIQWNLYSIEIAWNNVVVNNGQALKKARNVE